MCRVLTVTRLNRLAIRISINRDIGNEIDRRLWAQLPTIPLYQVPGFLAWRQDLVNVEPNTTQAGPFWNAGTWGSPNHDHSPRQASIRMGSGGQA